MELLIKATLVSMVLRGSSLPLELTLLSKLQDIIHNKLQDILLSKLQAIHLSKVILLNRVVVMEDPRVLIQVGVFKPKKTAKIFPPFFKKLSGQEKACKL